MAAPGWLLDQQLPPPVAGSEEGPETALARQALDALRALPADEQRARVAALRAAELTCAEGDRLERLTGTDEARVRPLALYLRSRAVPATVAAIAGCAVTLWALGPASSVPMWTGPPPSPGLYLPERA
jgi:hypothetical protein